MKLSFRLGPWVLLLSLAAMAIPSCARIIRELNGEKTGVRSDFPRIFELS